VVGSNLTDDVEDDEELVDEGEVEVAVRDPLARGVSARRIVGMIRRGEEKSAFISFYWSSFFFLGKDEDQINRACFSRGTRVRE
jgi:hypothetical protein